MMQAGFFILAIFLIEQKKMLVQIFADYQE
jgi:hypothetical protein